LGVIQTFEIKVPENKTRLVIELLRELGVTVKVKKGDDILFAIGSKAPCQINSFQTVGCG
jgi:uncharacterized metal-binding protein